MGQGGEAVMLGMHAGVEEDAAVFKIDVIAVGPDLVGAGEVDEGGHQEPERAT
jgi:hypothetical protein